jgi:hypothetical protein
MPRTRPSRPRRPHRLAATAVTASLLGAVAFVSACTPDDPSTAPVDSCTAYVDRAADAAEIDDQIALLDTALVVCRSYESFDTRVSRYPSLIGFDTATFVQRRCGTVDDDDVRASIICTTTVVTTTVPPAPTVPEPVYLGQTLDGREIEIRPDADTPFVDDKPAAIVQIVDIAAEDGCPGVGAEIERWSALAADPVVGDEASVYAQHALNVAAFIDC